MNKEIFLLEEYQNYKLDLILSSSSNFEEIRKNFNARIKQEIINKTKNNEEFFNTDGLNFTGYGWRIRKIIDGKDVNNSKKSKILKYIEFDNKGNIKELI